MEEFTMWTYRVGVVLVFGIFLNGPARGAQPWLDALGKDTLVCVSPTADAQVKAAAQRVLEAVQAVQPQATMQDPDRLAFDYDALGTHHVIVVGQWNDNLVLRMTWGYWATSKAQRDWQAEGDSKAVDLLGLWDKDIPPQPWRYLHDFFAFGYGEFDGSDIGYVQTVRNPFPILLRTVPREADTTKTAMGVVPREGQMLEQPTYDTTRTRINDRYPYNQMYFMIHLTGTGPAGVTKAVDAFLSQGLLNGVIPGVGKPLLNDWNLEGLGPKQLAAPANLPSWAPISALPAGVHYLGQQMVGSHLYGGFTQASGQRPVQCWRLKYSKPNGFVMYDSYPTNRASGNELFIAEMADAATAANAAQALQKTAGPQSRETATWEFGGHTYTLYATDIRNRMYWDEAKTFCEQQGGHLITINSEEEQEALIQQLLKTKTKTVYLGMSGNLSTNDWAWVTGEPITFRGWPQKANKDDYGKGTEDLPPGRYPVLLTQAPENAIKLAKLAKKGKLAAGWFVADPDQQTDKNFFVCEWDGPKPAPKPAPHFATRDQYVVMQSFTFDDPAGDALLHEALQGGKATTALTDSEKAKKKAEAK